MPNMFSSSKKGAEQNTPRTTNSDSEFVVRGAQNSETPESQNQTQSVTPNFTGANSGAEDLGVISTASLGVQKPNEPQAPEASAPHKAPVMTMLSAIEQTAGEKEKTKWEKTLKQKQEEAKKLLEQEQKKDSPENLLQKQFSGASAQTQVGSNPQGANAQAALNSQQQSGVKQQPAPKAPVITKKVGTIRTFRSDLQSVMQKDKLSLTKIVAIESDRVKHNKEAKKHNKDKKFMSLALLVLLLTLLLTLALVGYAVYLQRNSSSSGSSKIDNIAQPTETSLLDALIFIEDRLRIDVSGKSRVYVLRVLQAARDSTKVSSALGNIVEFELVKRFEGGYFRLPAKEVLQILYPKATNTFIETLQKKYMLGVHVTDKGRQPFAIFQVDSYQYAFAAMLDWEKSIEFDAGIFLDPTYGSEYKNIFESEQKFKDAVLKNYNVRALYNKEGKVKILYGFINQSTLVITSSPKTFLEIANRLAIEQN